jgi:hypothetical protein
MLTTLIKKHCFLAEYSDSRDRYAVVISRNETKNIKKINNLKGQCHEIFDLLFSIKQYTQGP